MQVPQIFIGWVCHIKKYSVGGGGRGNEFSTEYHGKASVALDSAGRGQSVVLGRGLFSPVDDYRLDQPTIVIQGHSSKSESIKLGSLLKQQVFHQYAYFTTV